MTVFKIYLKNALIWAVLKLFVDIPDFIKKV
jgi:hypothetical protein